MAFNDASKKGALRVFQDDFLDLPSDDINRDLDIPAMYDVDDFDVVSMIDKSRDEDTQAIRDVKIDDSDIPRADNFFHYCTTMLGKDAKIPFARQMWIAYTLFAEYCPVCTDPKWTKIETVPVTFPTKEMPEHVQFLVKGKCTRCKGTRGQFIKEGKLNFYSELDACLGQRAGKSAITSTMASYSLHSYLKLPKMSLICDGIQDSTPLTATFVGVRFSDAFRLLWTPIVNIIGSSPWFKDYHDMLKHYGQKYGKELFKQSREFITYGNKNLELYPSGPTKRGLRGRTRFFGAIDELGWFPVKVSDQNNEDPEDSEREHADAEEVYTALDRSLSTVRVELLDVINKRGANTLMNALQVNISSPSSKKDKLYRLMEANKHSNSALSLHFPTWEINPRWQRDHPEIVKAYKDNPSRADRDYGANPPVAASPFMELHEQTKKCFATKNTVSLSYADREWHGKMYRAAKLNVMHPPNMMPPSMLCIDAGYNNNSFALIVGYRRDVTIHCPVLIEVQPGKGNIIHYNALYEKVIAPIIKTYNVKYMFADRWQSIAILHRAMDEFGIEGGMYSVKMHDFNLAKSKLESVEFQLPEIEEEVKDSDAVVSYPAAFHNKPSAHLFFQMKTVQELGKTVIKGEGYTDDMWRALVLLSSRMFDKKIEENMAKLMVKRRSTMIVGIVRSQSDFGTTYSPKTLKHVSMGRRSMY